MTCGFMNSAEVAAKELWERAVLVCGLGRAELVRSALCVCSVCGQRGVLSGRCPLGAVWYPDESSVRQLTWRAQQMATGSVFENNRTQAVRLPAETRFPETVKKVSVRVLGNERILSPIDSTWDSFFDSEEAVSEDFMTARASQHQSDRESL